MPKEHSCFFLNDSNDGIGMVFEHMYNAIASSRVEVTDIRRRQHILSLGLLLDVCFLA